MQYVRMFTGADGQTQFEEVAVPGTPGGGGSSELSAPIPVLGAVFARLAAGFVREPHVAPRRLLNVSSCRSPPSGSLIGKGTCPRYLSHNPSGDECRTGRAVRVSWRDAGHPASAPAS